MPKKFRFKGVYNISGELHTLYAWAWSERQAHFLFKERLEMKLGRKLYMKWIKFHITKEE